MNIEQDNIDRLIAQIDGKFGVNGLLEPDVNLQLDYYHITKWTHIWNRYLKECDVVDENGKRFVFSGDDTDEQMIIDCVLFFEKKLNIKRFSECLDLANYFINKNYLVTKY